MSCIISIADQLAELEKLSAGWYDGAGEPVHPNNIAWVRAHAWLVEAANVPYLYPTYEGGISVEFENGRSFVVDYSTSRLEDLLTPEAIAKIKEDASC